MRTFVFLGVLSLASADSRIFQQSDCLVDGAEAVSDLMDSSMFVWAAVARCGHGGEQVKCEINIASAIQSVNSMINVILKALDKCGELHSYHHKCGMAAGSLTKSTAGLAAASGGIAQKCFAPATHGNNWNHAEPALCVVNIKNTAKSLFKTIKAFMKLKSDCEDPNSRECASNALRIVAAFASLGEYLSGAIGQCSPNGMQGSVCAQQTNMLVHQLTKVAKAGVDLSRECEEEPEPAAPPAKKAAPPAVDMLATSRLYSEKKKDAKDQTAIGASANLLLAAFLPVTAIVGFVGGRFYANRRSSTEQAREFMSDNE